VARFDLLGPSHLADLAGLCQRALPDPPTAEELGQCLFSPDQPATVRGDPEVGVVATVRQDGRGFVRLLAVDPAHRRRGHGSALLSQAAEDLAEVGSITVGADPPYFLYPGVETTQTAMLCLLERHRFQRVDANFNMEVDLEGLPPDPGGWQVASPAERPEVSDWMAEQWPNWRAEALRALERGTLVISRDERGIAAFCAYDVNRRGLLGPVAARTDLFGQGAGRPVLLGALHSMRRAGQRRVEVVWVGPVLPYARVGGRVSRVFFVYRKDLTAKEPR